MSEDRHSRAWQAQQDARQLERWDRLTDEREAAERPVRRTELASHRTLAGQAQSMARKPRILSAISDPYALTTAELVRIVAARVNRHPRVRRGKLSEYELAALAQDVAVSLLPGQRHGTARDVLDWIDYAMSHPALAARAERIPRGTIGRTLIDERIARILHESRGWRDTVEAFRVKDRASRQTERDRVAQVIAADFSEPGDDDEMSASYRALIAASIERGDISAPIALDAEELAQSIASGYGTRERDHVRAAIVRVCADDPARAMAKLAKERGKSINAVRVEASKGAAILRKMDLRELRALAEAARDQSGETDLERLVRNLPAAWAYIAPHHPKPEPRLSLEPESLTSVGR